MGTKITTIIFKEQILMKEISAFRGAIMSMFPDEAIYHNHEDKGFIYGYPSIQYKILNGSAAIVGIGEGADSLDRHWNEGDTCRLLIHEDIRNLKVVAKDTIFFSHEKECYEYTIRNWLPLNQANYRTYKAATGLIEQVSILERMLKGNILSLYKGLGIWLEEELTASITRIGGTKTISYKHNELLSFDVSIKLNFPLPGNCGLGKGSSKGYGIINPKNAQ